MDPNEMLLNVRAAIADARKEYTYLEEHHSTLVYAFEALDDWLSSGGELPIVWKPPVPIHNRPSESNEYCVNPFDLPTEANTMTENDLNRLKATKSESEWNALCDEIKNKNGGYPSDWFAKVVLSGLMASAQNNWK